MREGTFVTDDIFVTSVFATSPFELPLMSALLVFEFPEAEKGEVVAPGAGLRLLLPGLLPPTLATLPFLLNEITALLFLLLACPVPKFENVPPITALLFRLKGLPDPFFPEPFPASFELCPNVLLCPRSAILFFLLLLIVGERKRLFLREPGLTPLPTPPKRSPEPVVGEATVPEPPGDELFPVPVIGEPPIPEGEPPPINNFVFTPKPTRVVPPSMTLFCLLSGPVLPVGDFPCGDLCVM